MTKNNLMLGLVVSASSLALAVSPVAAYMEQSQQFSQSVSSSTKIENGSAEKVEASASGSQSGSQTQIMTGSAGADRGYNGAVGGGYTQTNRNYVYRQPKTTKTGYGYVPGMYINGLDNGQVWLGWGVRGGTCHVRYTENRSRTYQYATATSCDEGGITIGGLQPGMKYRFQISQDRNRWSQPVVITAR